jgi:hypothetical protein
MTTSINSNKWIYFSAAADRCYTINKIPGAKRRKVFRPLSGKIQRESLTKINKIPGAKRRGIFRPLLGSIQRESLTEINKIPGAKRREIFRPLWGSIQRNSLAKLTRFPARSAGNLFSGPFWAKYKGNPCLLRLDTCEFEIIQFNIWKNYCFLEDLVTNN